MLNVALMVCCLLVYGHSLMTWSRGLAYSWRLSSESVSFPLETSEVMAPPTRSAVSLLSTVLYPSGNRKCGGRDSYKKCNDGHNRLNGHVHRQTVWDSSLLISGRSRTASLKTNKGERVKGKEERSVGLGGVIISKTV